MDEFPGQARLVSENFGASKLAERFGVTRYPAVFVNDVLVARPRDFGFFAEGENSGRYTPWKNADSQARFKADLARMVRLALAGRSDEIKELRGDAGGDARDEAITSLPPLALTDLAGKPIAKDALAGKVVLVEFWATWCPPCHATLEWLATLEKKYGDRLAIVALAVESPEAGVRSTAAGLPSRLHFAIADAPTAQSFGNVMAVPTLFVFDRSGKTAKVVYGAPPDLHETVGATVERLLH